MKFLKLTSFFLIVMLSHVCRAQLPTYSPGTGAQYTLQMMTSSAEVQLSVVSSVKDKLVTEMFFSVPGSMIPIEMWQQFHMERKSLEGPISVSDGYVMMQPNPKPQKLTPDYLKGYADGPQLNDFLFHDEKKMAKYKTGTEELSLPFGKLKTERYKMDSNGQVIEFWLNKEAKPFGLVKLKSSGAKPDQNFSLTLGSILTNVKAKIDPKQSVPMDAITKTLLSPLGPRFLIP